MSKFDLFRKRSAAENSIIKKSTVEFIEKSLSSVLVFDNQKNEDIRVVLTRDHLEGNSQTLLFSYLENSFEVGDYITHNNKKYLVFLEFDHPLKSDYLKYKLVECNINIKIDDLSLDGAYFSSLRQYVTTVTRDSSSQLQIFENMKPVVIVKDNEKFQINTKFLAAKEPFNIVNIDRITNPGLAYLSLEQTTINPILDNLSTGKTETEKDTQKPFDQNKLKTGQILEINTNQGFIQTDPVVRILDRTLSKVTIQIPFDAKKIKILTKNNDGDVVTTIKEVV